MNREVLRLAGLLACIALATSRIGLIGHELVAHGGMALALGAEVTEVRLFWFAGGWIRYELASPSLAAVLAISMAGIAFELLLGGALWLAVKGDSLGRRLVRGLGIALAVHATWYLAVGAFHGFGDGLVLYRRYSEARVPIAIVAGAATCVATYLGARALTAPLARTLPGTPRQRAIGFAIAALLGAGLHAGLTIGELRMRRDSTYARVMKPERERKIAIELQQWQRHQQARGVTPSADAERIERARLENNNPAFPFVPVLAFATVLALLAGIVRSRGGSEEPVPRRLILRTLIVALASICAVIVLDVVFSG